MMNNREHNQAAIHRCNAMARWNQADWMPVQITEGKSLTPNGLKTAPPAEVMFCSQDEMLDYLNEHKLTAISVLGL